MINKKKELAHIYLAWQKNESLRNNVHRNVQIVGDEDV